jgi:hypothetical protein
MQSLDVNITLNIALTYTTARYRDNVKILCLPIQSLDVTMLNMMLTYKSARCRADVKYDANLDNH